MVVRVVAGVMRDAHERVLISERPPGKHMSGYWEFPGGKIAQGESAEAALARELSEELGVQLERCRPLRKVRHDYTDRTVELDVLIVEAYQGAPVSLEGQALKWVRVQELSSEALLPADRPIVEALVAETDTAAA
jgi:8-oxo-dGTP diphosphatase